MGMNACASRMLALSGLLALMAACATDSVVVTGSPRPAISPADVKIYSRPPAVFEEIAILNTSKNSAFTTGGQKTVDKVIAGLKEQAAKVGANGVILEGFSDQPNRFGGIRRRLEFCLQQFRRRRGGRRIVGDL